MTKGDQQQQETPSGNPDAKGPSSPSVRVFISSTFRDMHAERDHLITFVFPELRERCEQLGLEFFDVDLRWGVPEKDPDGERANSWEYCKQWIDRVEPFFVCILGQRYGYVPKPQDIRDPADRKRFADLSITEMEIRHAVLTGSLRRRSFFYFRKTRVPKIVDTATKKNFVEDDDKVEKLKNEISKGSRPVRKYSCDWIEDHFAKLEEFGRQVLDDLWSGVLRDQRYISTDVWRQVLGGDPLSDSRYTDESIPVPEDIAAKIVELAKPAPASPLDAEAAKMEAFAASRLRWFTGRTEELQTLSDFVEATGPDAPAMAVVGAVPGQGKSALLAKLHQKLNASSHFVITHFVGATERSADPRALVKRLINELDRSGIAWPEEQQEQETKDDFISQIFLLARRLESYAGKRRIVLLLDAVNQLSDGHDLNWLPQQPGPNVRIIVSCIEDPAAKAESPDQTILQSLSSRYPTALRVLLSGLSPKDIRAIVVDYLHEYCKELDPPHIDALCNIPQASNPLYLLVALSELRTLGGNDMNEIVPRLITSLPTDYPDTVSLFRWVVKRLEVFGKEETRHWCLYLAHGRVGMSSRELADLLVRKFGPDAALLALRIERGLRRYLQRRGGQLDFFHSQLRQAVFEQYQPQAEAAGVHMDIAAYFRELADPENNQNWTDKHPRAISELPYHAWKAHSQELIYLLARDDGFLKNQQDCISEDPDLPLRTIRYALDAACVAEEPVQMAEFTLKHANYRAQQSQETPLDALMNPNLPPQVALERAWKLADLLDNQQRSYALLLLTWKLQKLQRTDEAAATLNRIDPHKAVKLGDLEPLAAILLSQIKPIEGIDLSSIVAALLEDNNLVELSKSQAQAGQFAEALRSAGKIKDNYYRSEAFAAIAQAQTQAGPDPSAAFAEALRTAGQIEDEWRRSKAFVAIAKAQVQARQDPSATFAEALRSAGQTEESIEDAWGPSEAFAAIAQAQTQAGLFAEALRTAGQIEDKWRRYEAFVAIVEAQAQAGLFAEALRTAGQIEDEWRRYEAFVAIVEAQAQAGLFAEALRTAEKIEDYYDRVRAFAAIAQAQTQARQNPSATFAEAFRCAGQIENERRRPEAFVAIAQTQVQAGQDPSETFAEALRTAEKIEYDFWRFEAFASIAEAQAKAGQDPTSAFAEALRTAEKIEDYYDRVRAFAFIAQAQTQARQDPSATFAEAFRYAGQIENERRRPEAFVAIVETQAQAGQFAEALRYAGKIKDNYYRSKAFVAIAQTQVQAEQDPSTVFAEALCPRKIENAYDCSKAVVSIAHAKVQIREYPTEDTLCKEITCIDQIPIRREVYLNAVADYLSIIPSLAVKPPVLQEYLPRVAHYLESACRACGLLAHLYPSHATAIAKLLGVGDSSEDKR